MAEAKTTKRTTKTTAAEAPAKVEKQAPAKKPAAAKAPAKKAAPAKTAAAAKTVTTAKAPAKKAAPAKKPMMDAEFRMRLINDTAYYISEKRCSIASAEDDWLFAELLIDSVAFAVSQK